MTTKNDTVKVVESSVPLSTTALVVQVRLVVDPPLAVTKSTESATATATISPPSLTLPVSTAKSALEKVSFELRRRGFIVEAVSSDELPSPQSTTSTSPVQAPLPAPTVTALPTHRNHWILVTVSTKLLIRLALLRGFPVLPFDKYGPLQRLQLSQAAVSLLLKNKADLHVEHAWIAHDPVLFRALFQENVQIGISDSPNSNSSNPITRSNTTGKGTTETAVEHNIDTIYRYFGPQLGTYFGFLQHYTRSLLLPSLLGVIVFVQQYWQGQIDTEYTPFFVVLLVIWSTWFLQTWKCKASTYAFAWETIGVEEKELDRQLAKVIYTLSFPMISL
jgi:hypothetical protein